MENQNPIRGHELKQVTTKYSCVVVPHGSSSLLYYLVPVVTDSEALMEHRKKKTRYRRVHFYLRKNVGRENKKPFERRVSTPPHNYAERLTTGYAPARQQRSHPLIPNFARRLTIGVAPVRQQRVPPHPTVTPADYLRAPGQHFVFEVEV